MPLSKARNRARMRQLRASLVQPVCNPKPVQPIKANETVQPDLPLYNPAIHKPGDKVYIYRNGQKVEYDV